MLPRDHRLARRTLLAAGIGGAVTALGRGRAAAAPPPSGLAVAESYVRAYSAMESRAMAAWMTEDFIFSDRTGPEAGKPLEGREAVLALIDHLRSANGLVDLGLDLPARFESNGVAVFSGTVNSISRRSPESAGLKWSARTVLVLTLRGDRICRHEDFADYAGAVVSPVEPSARM